MKKNLIFIKRFFLILLFIYILIFFILLSIIEINEGWAILLSFFGKKLQAILILLFMLFFLIDLFVKQNIKILLLKTFLFIGIVYLHLNIFNNNLINLFLGVLMTIYLIIEIIFSKTRADAD